MQRRSLGLEAATHPEHLATGSLPPRLLVIENAHARREDNVAKLTGGQQVVNPLFNLPDFNVEARADNADLVDTANQVNDNLSAAVIVDNLKFANVAYTRVRGGMGTV